MDNHVKKDALIGGAVGLGAGLLGAPFGVVGSALVGVTAGAIFGGLSQRKDRR